MSLGSLGRKEVVLTLSAIVKSAFVVLFGDLRKWNVCIDCLSQQERFRETGREENENVLARICTWATFPSLTLPAIDPTNA